MFAFMLLAVGAAALAFACLRVVTFVVIQQDANRLIVDVTSDDVADTGIVIPHGMGSVAVPKIPQQASYDELLAEGHASQWRTTARDATNVTFAKTPGAGTFNAAAQVRITIELPHSVNG